MSLALWYLSVISQNLVCCVFMTLCVCVVMYADEPTCGDITFTILSHSVAPSVFLWTSLQNFLPESYSQAWSDFVSRGFYYWESHVVIMSSAFFRLLLQESALLWLSESSLLDTTEVEVVSADPSLFGFWMGLLVLLKLVSLLPQSIQHFSRAVLYRK